MREPAQIIEDSQNTMQELAGPLGDAQKRLKLWSAAASLPCQRRWALRPALAAALLLGICFSLLVPKVRQGLLPLSRSEPGTLTEQSASQAEEPLAAKVQNLFASATVPAERGKPAAPPGPTREKARAGSRPSTSGPLRNEADIALDNGHRDNFVESRCVTNAKCHAAKGKSAQPTDPRLTVNAQIEAPGEGKQQPQRKQGKPAPEQQQMSRIQALLDEAEEANGKGCYLEAALRWGEVALMHSALLPQVESPEAVRKKFVNALKRYQQAVERALQEVRQAQGNDHRADPAAGQH